MKAYKGFNEDMTCRNFQYEEGKEYEEKEAVICRSGFHACLNPIDVFKYYGPLTSVYHEVELEGHTEIGADSYNLDSKLCATKIKIGPVIKLSDFIKKAVDYMINNFEKAKRAKVVDHIVTTSDDQSRCGNESTSTKMVCNFGSNSFSAAFDEGNTAINTGFSSIAVTYSTDSIAIVNGSNSVSVATAKASVAISNGEQSVTENYGDMGLSAQMGSDSIADSEGENSVSINMGAYGRAIASGIDSSAIVAGARSEAIAEKKGSIACALGSRCIAKGCVGSWLLLTEWVATRYSPIRYDVRLFYVDGEKVKADTFYKLINGQLTEA